MKLHSEPDYPIENRTKISSINTFVNRFNKSRRNQIRAIVCSLKLSEFLIGIVANQKIGKIIVAICISYIKLSKEFLISFTNILEDLYIFVIFLKEK